MAIQLKEYQIFIASHEGFAKEGEAFTEVVHAYNNAATESQQVVFDIAGRKDSITGKPKTQTLINEEIKACVFFIMMLDDNSDADIESTDMDASSSVEAEYNLAMQCLQDKNYPMRQIIIYFKAGLSDQSRNQSKRSKKEIALKKQVQNERNLVYSQFSTLDEFKILVRKHLSSWIMDDEPSNVDGHKGSTDSSNTKNTASSPENIKNSNANEEVDSIIDGAWKLADEGKVVDAEKEFSKAVAKDPSGSQLLQYANFLLRIGQPDRAIRMIDKSIALALDNNDSEHEVHAYSLKGLVLQLQGDLDAAEEMYTKSLKIEETLKHLEGVANQYGNLGNVFHLRDDLDGAETMYKKALEINKKLGRLEGMVADYGHLGIVFQIRDDLDGAEEMYKKVIEIEEKLSRPEGIATAYGNLGIVLHTRGDLNGAESMYTKSLKIAEHFDFHQISNTVSGQMEKLRKLRLE